MIAEIHDEMKAIMRQFADIAADIAAGLGVDLAEEAADLS